MNTHIPANLLKDPIMKKLLAQYQIKAYWGGQSNHFLDLVEIITGQQLSMKAADTIFKRFISIFDTKTPQPEQVLKVSTEKLRSVGLSNSKAQYVHNIALAIVSKSLPIDKFNQLPDEVVQKELIKIKGLGPWSVDMFLIFSLKRPDVFSVGDLGLRTAIEHLYGINRDDKKAILALAETWRPHRTLASRLLWSSLG